MRKLSPGWAAIHKRGESVHVFGWPEARNVTVLLNKTNGESALMKTEYSSQGRKRTPGLCTGQTSSLQMQAFISILYKSAQERAQSHARGIGSIQPSHKKLGTMNNRRPHGERPWGTRCPLGLAISSTSWMPWQQRYTTLWMTFQNAESQANNWLYFTSLHFGGDVVHTNRE